MAEEKFIWCVNCNEVHHVTPYDKAPVYLTTEQQDEGLSQDDWRRFMHQHAGHRLEALRAGDHASWEGGSSDPTQERYLEVTNGDGWFVVRGSRRSIEEPLGFEVIPGRLSIKKVSVEVQENDVRKELKKHFSWGVFLPTHEKIDLFVALFKQLVCGLDPDHVSVSRHDYRDGALGYAALDDVLVENLLQQCRPYFPPEELSGLKRFLESQKEPDSVMALRVRHQYGILKSARGSLKSSESK